MSDVSLEQALNAEVDQVSNETEAAPAETQTDETVTETAEATATESTDETAETAESSTSGDDIQATLKAMQDQIAEANKKVDAFQKMAIDERNKRQQAETKPDFWEDPDSAIGAISEDFNTKLQTMQTNMMVEVMKSTHDDYSEMEALFIADAEENHALIAQMSESGNPAKFAYDYGKTKTQMAEMSDPDAYRAKIEAEVRAKLEAEQQDKIEKEIRKHNVPSSIANERSSGGTVPTARPELDKLIG